MFIIKSGMFSFDSKKKKMNSHWLKKPKKEKNKQLLIMIIYDEVINIIELKRKVNK